MKNIPSGYSFYGQKVGVLVFANVTPRLPGDAGHAASYSYPVRFEVVPGSFADMLEVSEKAKASIVRACRNLASLGITAVVADCGMMSLYQDCIGSECGIMFAGSSLIQIPMIWQLTGRSGSIGIITGHSGMLNETHLRNSGWTPEMKLSIQGLEDEPHFAEIVIHGGRDMDPERMRKDILDAALRLRDKTPDLRVVVFECSNLATYSKDVAELLGVPVFDTISAANLIAYAASPPSYPL